MFSKLVIASTAYLTADALKVSTRNKSHLKTHASIPTSCGSNIARQTSPNETQDFAKYSGGSTMYEDPDMPATTDALYWSDHLRNQYSNVASNKMKDVYDKKVSGWARPSELVNKPSLFGNKGVMPNGTNQGSLGDCWFLASAAALAENPERVTKIFTNQGYDSAGIFQVTFHQEGSPIKITVDDRLPYNEGTNPRYTSFGVKTPVNSHMSTNGAWWVPILEKAYSKFNVNYAQLSGGQAQVALRELTGMPVVQYDRGVQSVSELYDTIKQADQNNWVMTAGCDTDLNGLNGGHAYSVLDAYQLQGGPKVLKMRNPWSSETYTGPYSDSSSAWTEAQKAQVGLTVADDGIFFLPIDDFAKAFDGYDILMYQDWNIDTVKMSGTGKKHYKKFTSPVDQEVWISIEYQNPRQMEAGCPKEDIFFNYYIDGGDPNSVSTQIAYGIKKVQAVAGKAHEFKIINWGDVNVDAHYTMQTFAAGGVVKWSD